MLTDLPREFAAYATGYKGKQMLIGMLDSDFLENELSEFLRDIAFLREANIRLRLFATRKAIRDQLHAKLPHEMLLDAQKSQDENIMTSIIEYAGAGGVEGWEEMMLLRNQGGLKRKNLALPLLSSEGLHEILDTNTRGVTCDEETREILIATRLCIEKLGKVVITDVQSIKKEIGTWMGAGTLIFDHRQLSMGRMYYGEHPIFDAMYKSQVESGAFKQRDSAGLEELRIHHEVVRIKNSVLGGMSLLPRGEWQELSALWGAVPKSGIGKYLLDQACKKANGSNVVACTVVDDVARLFQNHPEFTYQGKVSAIRQHSSFQHPSTVQSYDTSTGRDPHVFYRIPTTRPTPSAYPVAADS